MDIIVAFVPLLIGLAVPVGAIIVVWIIFKKSSSDKDQMLKQLMMNNKELEEKVDQLLERKNHEENTE